MATDADLTPPWLPEFLDLHRVSTLLDVGCGSGAFTAFLSRHIAPGGHVVGIDIEEAALDRARRIRSIGWLRGNAIRLPVTSNSASLVICRRLLLNLTDPDAALREMARVTRPGGSVAALEPDFLSEGGHSTVPGELEFLRRLLLATSTATDLSFGSKAAAAVRRAGLASVKARIHTVVVTAAGNELPTPHRERASGRLVDLVERWRSDLAARAGQAALQALAHEADSLDRIRNQQLASGVYSAATSFPLWVVRGRKGRPRRGR